jgi:hypothetical protein
MSNNSSLEDGNLNYYQRMFGVDAVVKPEITAKIALKSSRFWKMVFMIYCSFFLLSFVQSAYKSMAIGVS